MTTGLITGDVIRLSRIGIFAYHGVYEEEGRLGQRFYLTLELGLDLGPAGRSDDLNQTVSYADIATRVQEIAVSQRFQIIEALAEAIAGDLLANFPRLREVAVTVEKPHAAVMAILETLSVTIHRVRSA
ncbi:MAG: dihydroneopterin aldolase [Beijerinckiaceae bacterium]|nr:dihydroneopterin aldolase [Beijerinckiaceae bacterium]MCZ8298804.1 dihydroneopterin aldolase [Beijerinckiaceae bacterium]